MDNPVHTQQTDDDLDPLELQDVVEEEEEVVELIPEEEQTVIKEEQELVKEIEKVAPDPEPEAVAPKKGSHVIPRHLIDQPLKPEDLMDEGAL